MPPVTCEFIQTARPVDKATTAEKMWNTRHRLSRCDKCEKFHIWTEVSYSEWFGAASAATEARTSFYVQVGVNAYLHKGFRLKKAKKAKNGNDGDDIVDSEGN